MKVNDEIRMTIRKEFRMTKSETPATWRWISSSFELRQLFVIRHLRFVILDFFLDSAPKVANPT
jgi:hypothetical protein